MSEVAGGITVSVEGRAASGWPEAREDLGLNRAGPEPIEGVRIVDEVVSDVTGTGESVTLRFSDVTALERARDRLEAKRMDRAEWGSYDEAEEVERFAVALPSRPEVESDG
jgi:hypothetical protein